MNAAPEGGINDETTTLETPKGKVWHFNHMDRGMIYGRVPTTEEIQKNRFAVNAIDQGAMITVARTQDALVVLCDENGDLILCMQELRD